MQFFFEGYDLIYHFDHEALFRIDFHLTSGNEFPCCIDQDRSEYIDNPVKILEKRYSGKDKYHSKKYRSEHSPEQYLVLIHLRDSEIGKYNREYKYIIYRKCLLDDISREEFECLLFTEPLIYESVKNECQWYPYPWPRQSFFHTHFCTLSVEHSEIQREHEEDKYIKPHPEPDIDFHKKQ
jgi:hypothetical protein